MSDRFWERVEKTPTCWLWVGSVSSEGYGGLYVDGRNVRAHRYSYELHTGRPIPEGMVIDHICRVRNCVNPDHLRVVDNRTNILAGIGPSAIRARQTHCVNGHEFTPENIKWKSNGCRQCRICARRRQKEWEMRVRSERRAARLSEVQP